MVKAHFLKLCSTFWKPKGKRFTTAKPRLNTTITVEELMSSSEDEDDTEEAEWRPEKTEKGRRNSKKSKANGVRVKSFFKSLPSPWVCEALSDICLHLWEVHYLSLTDVSLCSVPVKVGAVTNYAGAAKGRWRVGRTASVIPRNVGIWTTVGLLKWVMHLCDCHNQVVKKLLCLVNQIPRVLLPP